MAGAILDASVLLAIVLDEVTADDAEQWLRGASMSAVNLSEVVARLRDLGHAANLVADSPAAFDLDVVPFDTEQAVIAGNLRLHTRDLGLSLGDRACLALAQQTGRRAVTADRAWARLDLAVEVEVIR